MASVEAIARREARRQGVPVNLVLSVIRQESGGRPDAVSPAGAQGVMQLMPATAKALGVKNPLDPAQNIRGGVKYLKQQFRTFGSWKLALAAYNAGPGAVQEHRGVPPFRETQSYVRNVLAAAGDLADAPQAPPAALPPDGLSHDSDPLAQQAFAGLSSLASGRFDPLESLTSLSFAAAAQPQSPSPVAQRPGAPVASPPQTNSTSVISAGFTPQFKSALDRLLEAAGGRVTVTSGYRSPERQAELYQAALRKYGSEQEARRWVAPPGRSYHGKGLAADLGGDLALAARLAPRFGLAFPLENEAWHVELAGARR